MNHQNPVTPQQTNGQGGKGHPSSHNVIFKAARRAGSLLTDAAAIGIDTLVNGPKPSAGYPTFQLHGKCPVCGRKLFCRVA